MNIAYIMRGVPGSGKSTMAKYLAEGKHAAICSTDALFYKDGVYEFDPTLLEKFHSKNLERFCYYMIEGYDVVICDNTNVKSAHYTTYVTAAQKCNYRVAIVTLPHPDPHVASERSIHNVPPEVIQRMIEQWEP